jgi:protein SCO1/2
MADSDYRLTRTLWVGVFLLLAILCVLWLASLQRFARNRLPALPVLGPVADFSLTNQDGVLTTLKDLTNHVWVADIIFTRCAGPCPRMTQQMKSLQDKLPDDSAAQLVTLTTDPDHDTPTILHRYAEHYGADTRRWHFLTGTKAQIAGLGGDSLKLSAVPVKPEDRKDDADLFIHSTIFVLVDKHAQLRGVFETGGDNVDWANDMRPKLLQAIRKLEREP